MRYHRFYLKQPLGEEIVVDEKEVLNQWFLVFRLKTGSQVVLFNGDGFDYLYEIVSYDKKEAELSFVSQEKNFIPKKKVSLYISIIKKDKFEWIVEKGTELGVSQFIPLISERSEKKNLNLERLEKIIKEAAEQSGRGDLPGLSDIVSLEKATISSKNIVVLDPKSKENFKGGNGAVSIFIGPEGGWSDKELEVFDKKGVDMANIGKTILKAETAAIVASALALI